MNYTMSPFNLQYLPQQAKHNCLIIKVKYINVYSIFKEDTLINK